MKLLTTNNPKTLKGDAYGYLTAILHLAPSWLSGYNMCPLASKGCAAACLNTAGRGGMTRKDGTNVVQNARIARTKFYMEDRQAFLAQLVEEIDVLEQKAIKANLQLAIRLNGTSDVQWENIHVGEHANIMDEFPNVQFYDYTKIPHRMFRSQTHDWPRNYHLTFSRSETNDADALQVLAKGGNVAVVFSGALPERWNGFEVFNGDMTDLRFLDNRNVVVGLKAKGKGKKDTSGFVVTSN